MKMSDSERILNIYNKLFKAKINSLEILRKEHSEWDSMKHAELIINLQKEFSVKFSMEKILTVESLKDFLPLVKKE
jgi:acyl carrier protein